MTFGHAGTREPSPWVLPGLSSPGPCSQQDAYDEEPVRAWLTMTHRFLGSVPHGNPCYHENEKGKSGKALHAAEEGRHNEGRWVLQLKDPTAL